LSGNYPHHGTEPYGTWSFGPHSQFRKNQRSIAETLRNAEYGRAIFGKWHVGAKVSPNGRMLNRETIISQVGDDWSPPLVDGPGDLGFDHSYIVPQGIQAPPYTFFRDDYIAMNASDAIMWKVGEYDKPNYKGTSMIRDGFPGEGDPKWDSSAFDMTLVDETKTFVEDHIKKRPNDPFFAYVALGAVHIPRSPPNVYTDTRR